MTAAKTTPVRVALAADENYARPLAVAARSVIDNLEPSRLLEVHVLDAGISSETRRKIELSLRDPRVKVVWYDGLAASVAGLPTFGFFTPTTYARLFLPKLLPETVDRMLYLDCDVLVRVSATPFFDMDLDSHAALAVPDMGAPFVSCPWGLALWFESGRHPDELNFNMGVLLMNLDYWRRERVGDRALEYLRSERYQYNVDQEALNALIGNDIRPVDPHWNQQGELYHREAALALPYSRDVVQSVKDDPWIIHYSNVVKPWHRDSPHQWAGEWMRYLDRTAFAGWRPPPEPRIIQLARHSKSTVKKVARKFGLL